MPNETEIALSMPTLELVQKYVESVKARPKLPDRTAPIGKDGKVELSEKDTRPPDVRLAEKVTKRAKADGINYDAAFLLEAAEDPDLYKEYRRRNYRLIAANERGE